MANKNTSEVIAGLSGLQTPDIVAKEAHENSQFMRSITANSVGDASLGMVKEIARSNTTDRRAVADVMEIVGMDLSSGNDITANSYLSPEVLLRDAEEQGVVTPERRRRIARSKPTMEKLTRADHFPNADQPINQGTFSSKTLGGVPIFAAPGALVPMEAFNARDRSLEKLAEKRREQRKAIMLSAKVKGAAQVDAQLQDMSMQVLNDWGEKTDWQFDLIYEDPKMMVEYQGEVQKLQSFAAETVWLDGLTDQVMADSLDPTKYVPEHILRTAESFSHGIVNLEDWRQDPKQMQKIANELSTYNNMVHHINKSLKDGTMQKSIDLIVEDALLNDLDFADNLFQTTFDNADATVISRAMFESLSDERIERLAFHMQKSGGTFANSKEDFIDYIRNSVGHDMKIGDHVISKAMNLQYARNAGKTPPKEVTEGIHYGLGNKMWDRKTNAPRKDFVTTMNAASDASEVRAVFEDNYGPVASGETALRRDLELSYADTAPRNLSGNEPGMNFELAGNQAGAKKAWYSWDKSLQILEERWGDKTAAMKAIENSSAEDELDQGLTKFDFDSKVAKITETVLAGMDAAQLGEFWFYQKMLQGKNGYSQEYRATNGTVEMHYNTLNGQRVLARATDIGTESGDINASRLKPYSTVTFQPVYDSFSEVALSKAGTDQKAGEEPEGMVMKAISMVGIDLQMPLATATYDLTGEGATNLDAMFSAVNTQRHREKGANDPDSGAEAPITSQVSSSEGLTLPK